MLGVLFAHLKHGMVGRGGGLRVRTWASLDRRLKGKYLDMGDGRGCNRTSYRRIFAILMIRGDIPEADWTSLGG
jgi:hypothetical protein